MKKWLMKLFYPHFIILIFGFIFIILSMGYVFLLKYYNEWISYVIYLLCSYFLIVICLRISKKSKEKINNWIEYNQYFKKMKEDPIIKTLFNLYKGITLNGIYAIFKLVSGIRYHSIWFITFGIYYLLIGSIRSSLVVYSTKNKLGEKILEEQKKYRNCGILLLLLNGILTIMIILVIVKNQTIKYPNYFIYVMAIYTFYIVIMGMINVIKYKKYKSPVMSAVRIINFFQALISMVSLEIAMLNEFGSENNMMFNRMMIGITGGVVSFIMIFISIGMVLKSKKCLKLTRKK